MQEAAADQRRLASACMCCVLLTSLVRCRVRRGFLRDDDYILVTRLQQLQSDRQADAAGADHHDGRSAGSEGERVSGAAHGGSDGERGVCLRASHSRV